MLDLDHVGAEVAHHRRDHRPGEERRGVDDLQALERERGVRRSVTLVTGPASLSASNSGASAGAVVERVVDEAPVDLDRRRAGGLGGLERLDDRARQRSASSSESSGVDALHRLDVGRVDDDAALESRADASASTRPRGLRGSGGRGRARRAAEADRRPGRNDDARAPVEQLVALRRDVDADVDREVAEPEDQRLEPRRGAARCDLLRSARAPERSRSGPASDRPWASPSRSSTASTASRGRGSPAARPSGP